MTFGKAVSTVLLRKYCCFSGRASRSEFWWFQLFCLLLALVLASWELFCPAVTMTTYWIMTGLLLIVHWGLLPPTLGVWVRRLHDRGKSGISCFITAICGEILLLWGYAVQIAVYSDLFSRYDLYGSFIRLILLAVALLSCVTGLYACWQSLFRVTDGPNAYGPDPLAAS